MPPSPSRTSPPPPLPSLPQRQDELQTASAPKEETLHGGDPSTEENTLVGTTEKMELMSLMTHAPGGALEHLYSIRRVVVAVVEVKTLNRKWCSGPPASCLDGKKDHLQIRQSPEENLVR